MSNFEDLIEDLSYPFLTRGYKEDRFPAPAQFFRREVREDDGRVEWKVDKLKVYVPPKVGNYFYITLENGEVMHIRQQERNNFLKNEGYEKQMKGLIDKFKSRDTEGNIKNLMNELEKIEENTLKKSISMYKINQMME
jgi:hypothetical protein